MKSIANHRKVLLLEYNEINWRVMDPLIARGKLPNFARLKAQGAWGAPVASEVPPYLDPWVTWVSVHTGVEREVHGASVLEQKGETIGAKRTWHYAVDAGKTVGIFGSITSYPPQPVPGFMVPGPFAPGGETYPTYLEPVQALNQRYTRVHNKLDSSEKWYGMIRQAARLFGCGLSPVTCARIAGQLALERVRPDQYWRRVSLQPLVNYDFFQYLYRRYQPDFATWHTNHCAHYMHHYWRAHDDSEFLVGASPEEKRKYGGAVEYGYRIADQLLGSFMRLVGDDTVLVVASSMGQKPYVVETFKAGRVPVRFKNIHAVLELLGAQGVSEVHAVMAPQWNIVVPDAAQRAALRHGFERCERHMHGRTSPMVSVSETGDTLTVTPLGLAEPPNAGIRFRLNGAPNDKPEGFAFDELFAADQPTPKQGMHDPRGVLMLWGAGITPGVRLDHTTNLDIAPTLLTLLGVPVPAVMTGRVLQEAWGQPCQRSEPAPLRNSSAVA